MTDQITRHQGSKFDRDRDVVDVAKLVRKDIKAAVAAGELPADAKYSVRISRFSMGRSVDVSVKLATSDVVWTEADDWAPARWAPSPERGQGEKAVQQILDQYSRWESDSMTDYHQTSFYTGIQVSGVRPDHIAY
jgi:hypothetical protein